MSFNAGLIFTNRGRILQAKAQAGTPLVFTRIAVGDGELGSQAVEDLTSLIHEVKSLSLNKFKILPGGKAVIGGILSNQDIATGFYWRELGLFATDPDLGEILYCYGNAGALAEYIPSPGGAEILEKQVDIVSIVGNATNISATIDQSLVFETLAGAQEKANAAENAAKQYADQRVNALAGEGNTKTVKQIDDELASHLAETASINAIGHVYAAEFTATLSTSWSGSAAPYTQTVTINGITSAHNPIIDVVMSGTYSTDQQRIEQWGYIYRAVTGTNQITFYASEKPTVSLPIRVKVVA